MDAPTEIACSWQKDARRLALLLVLAIAVRVWVIPHAEVTARDSIGFVRIAAHLEQPPLDYQNPGRTLSRLDVIRRSEHPPGYPIAIWGMAHLVVPLTGGSFTDPDTMVLASQLVSACAGILLIFPLYFITRESLGSANLAFIAVLLFQMLPGFVEVTSDGLSDGMYLLGSASTLALLVWAARSPRAWKYLLTGGVVGLTYLVRPEGLMLAIAGSLWMLVLALRGVWRWSGSISRITILGIGVAIVFVPYVGLTGKITNKPTGNQFLKWLLGEEVQPVWQGQTFAPSDSSVLLASWYQGNQPKVIWAAQAFAKEALKTGFYVIPLFAVLGVLVLGRRCYTNRTLLLLLLLGIVNTSILLAVAVMVGYVSERHTLLVVMLSSVFAASVMPEIGRWLASMAWVRRGDDRFWMGTTITLIVLAGMPVIFRPMHINRAGHHAAGLWLEEHAETNALILDPFCWSEFYAGHAWGYGPPRPPHHVGPIYIVAEPANLNPHSRLPLIQMTRTMMKAGTCVYQWPTDRSPEDAKVAIYRLVTE